MEVVTLIQGNEESSLTPFFLVHAISGVALPFLRLDSLGENDRPVYGITNHIHCPGHEHLDYPSSLSALAKRYLREIQKIQPHGPYLLGGWSFGGMIAMFMAQILESHDQEVLKVIMIDSANPEAFPSFRNAEEHKEFSRATYAKISEQLDANHNDDSSPAFSPKELHSINYHAIPDPNEWDTMKTGDTTSSRASSVFDFYTPDERPETPLSLPCSSEGSSALCSDEESVCGAQEEEYWDDFEEHFEMAQLKDLLLNISLHVHHGLGLITSVSPGDLFQPGSKSDFDVLLVKCQPEPLDFYKTHHDAKGAEFLWSVMREESMLWNAAQFRSFEVVPFSGDHDGAFEPQFVGELSMILRESLGRIG
ncbi:beta-ketoacyl synthase [Dactylonectria macrodidyma]|uniref:Beta-ketoacyl synthase n=1 Tax=Dactylonectria macrodidyma TaxID=307937 RepID=A0A9P9F0A6_9HYPO|nr:beta-ketoacyl synthase [Dactylonectria macrodidyma]